MTSTASGADVTASLCSIDSTSFSSDTARRQALQEAHALISRLETPYETSARLNVDYPATLACLQTALDLKLFHCWLSENDGKPCTAKELQGLIPQCDHNLFMRLLRHLVSSNVVWERKQESSDLLYEMTPFIYGQVKNDFASQLECTFLWAMPMMLSLPKFFQKIEYTDPQKASINPVKEYTGGMSMWQYLQANEGWANVFGRFMRASSKVRGDFMGLIRDQQLSCQSQDSVLLVDISGSQGRDLISFRQAFSEARGRLIVQDLSHVIATAPPLEEWGIEKMAYDFFTPQPIAEAKAYLLHNIIHDWPDEDAKRILETVATAMDKNESSLFIVDKVIRESSPMLDETSMDWLMMIYGNGIERTEEHWNRLIESAGLKIKDVKKSDGVADCLIEVVKV